MSLRTDNISTVRKKSLMVSLFKQKGSLSHGLYQHTTSHDVVYGAPFV